MKVLLLVSCDLGQAGDELTGPTVWRLCFPIKGCKATPADAEALAAVQADLATVDKGGALALVQSKMSTAGVLLALPEVTVEGDDEDDEDDGTQFRGKGRSRKPVPPKKSTPPKDPPESEAPAAGAGTGETRQDAGQAKA